MWKIEKNIIGSDLLFSFWVLLRIERFTHSLRIEWQSLNTQPINNHLQLYWNNNSKWFFQKAVIWQKKNLMNEISLGRSKKAPYIYYIILFAVKIHFKIHLKIVAVRSDLIDFHCIVDLILYELQMDKVYHHSVCSVCLRKINFKSLLERISLALFCIARVVIRMFFHISRDSTLQKSRVAILTSVHREIPERKLREREKEY